MNPQARSFFVRLGQMLWKSGWCVGVTLFALWAIGALWYDFPFFSKGVALMFAGLVVVLLMRVRGFLAKTLACVAAASVVLGWWLTLKPRQDRDWLDDVSRTARAEVRGDEVTLHDIRNFSYEAGKNGTPRWDSRTVRLSKVTGIDLAIAYWGSPYMAHPIASFQFSDAPPLCVSIETRKEKGESYSAIGGLFRQFELIYVVAEESDVLRVRTNFRPNDVVYLYRLNITADRARQRFLEYIAAINELHQQPRWYNAVTTNCTTSIRTQRDSGRRAPWDWRILVNGKADEMLFERGGFVSDGLTFPALRAASCINEAARQEGAGAEASYSLRVRQGRPGFTVRSAPVVPSGS